MNLLDLVRREPAPEPRTEGEKIPWDDPAFNARMLREHLSQEHDAASRRSSVIDAHVEWIHRQVLAARPSRILDLGCGPGLYTARLAALGHTCTGIDISPASIDYARTIAVRDGLSCTYCHEDVRSAEFGSGYELVMLIFGELNAFRPGETRNILQRAHAALVPGGVLLLEVHTFAAVTAMGARPATWRTLERGLFSDRPHLRLDESLWDGARQIAIHRYYIVDAATGAVTRHAESLQAYTADAYQALLTGAGFRVRAVHPSLAGTGERGDLLVLLGEPV
jgi:SAM-dependent methyltransferase